MKTILTWILVTMLWSFGSPAAAQWSEIRTENFVFQGQSEASKAQYFVRDLEAFRAAAIETLGGEARAEAVPIRVFAVKASPELESALPVPGFSVLSQSDLDGPVFLINDDVDWAAGGMARQTLLREYSHYLISRHAPDQYPYWMQSGLADYLSAGGANNAAQSVERYVYPLSRRKWVPMDTVLGAMRTFYPVVSRDDTLDTELFQQAQSWAAVRYIVERPLLAKRIPAYLDRLDAGERPDKAFKRGFGMSTRKFERRLKKRMGAEGGVRALAERSEELSAPLPQVHPMDASAASLAFGDLLRIFAYTEEGYAAAAAQYGAIAETSEAYGQGLAGLADIAAARGQFDEARTLMTQAASHAAEGTDIQKRTGGLYLSRFDETGEMEWLEPARESFAAVLGAEEGDPASNYYYAAICAQVECPAEAATRSVGIAMSYYHDAEYIPAIANLLPVLEQAGDNESLAAFSAFARIWGPKK